MHRFLAGDHFLAVVLGSAGGIAFSSLHWSRGPGRSVAVVVAGLAVVVTAFGVQATTVRQQIGCWHEQRDG